ncbi:hypothetical protein CFR71_15740, partial [Novacetimonas pomaceti]
QACLLTRRKGDTDRRARIRGREFRADLLRGTTHVLQAFPQPKDFFGRERNGLMLGFIVSSRRLTPC